MLVIPHLQHNHSSDCYFVHKFILLASYAAVTSYSSAMKTLQLQEYLIKMYGKQ